MKRGLACFVLLFIYWIAAERASQYVPSRPPSGMQLALPLGAEIVLAGGDRFAAANLGAFRALMALAESEDGTDLQVMAKVQNHVSWLNPGHEDNYYLSAAALVGSEPELHDSGQLVLRRAIDARPFDFVPPFYYGVNRMHYDCDPRDGARWLRVAAIRSDDENNRQVFEKTAIRWETRGQDPRVAVAVLENMSKQARGQSMRKYIERRLLQARAVLQLQEAAKIFEAKTGRRLSALGELISVGVLAEIPADPAGGTFIVDASGMPVISGAHPSYANCSVKKRRE